MMSRSQPLHTYITGSTWHQTLALLAAHQLPRMATQTKTVLQTVLTHHLLQPAVIEHSLAQLDAVGKDALRALLAAAGVLPVHTFEERFGPIRPYRPWRKDEPTTAQPWLAPISATESLWYLGLIFRDPPKATPGRVQHYAIPAELLPLLAAHLPVTGPDQNAYTPYPHPGRPADLLVHLGIWLATLAAEPVTLQHGRWLPPRLVAALAQRTGLDQAPDFRPQRSERYLPYLAFLHYLAEVAALAAGTDRLDITPQGWHWLAAPMAERWRLLWQSWLTASVEQAHPYRFAWHALAPQSRHQILQALRPLPLAHWLPLAGQLTQWRLQDVHSLLPAPRPATAWLDDEADDNPSTAPAAPAPTVATDPVAAFCTGPLFWLGLLDVASAVDDGDVAIRLTPHGAWLLRDERWRAPTAPPVTATLPKGTPDTLLLPVQAAPLHLAQLAPLCRWASTAPLELGQALTLDEARIGQAVARGLQPAQIFQYLAAALGRPPSRRLRQRVRTWAEQGQQVRLRSLLVLETATAELLAELQQRQLIRRRLDDTLGPRHVALNPEAAPGLLQSLATLGLYCEAPSGVGPAALTTADAADVHLPLGLQWLLLTLYRGLGAYVDLPVKPPWDGGRRLAAQLTPLQRAAAESAAAALLADLHASLDGYLRLPAWQMEHFPTTATLPLLNAALANHQDVELRYWSVNRGGPTLRRVTPQRLEEQAGVSYLHAFCHQRQTERVFRVDRIESATLLDSYPDEQPKK